MSLISVVFDEAQEVMGTVSKQAEAVTSMSNQLKNLMGPITGGSWTGAGAEAFTQEMMTKVLPEIAALVEAIAGFGGDIGSGLDLFSQADDQGAGLVGGLIDSIGSLF